MKSEENIEEQWEDAWVALQHTTAQLFTYMEYMSDIDNPTEDAIQSLLMLTRSLKRINKIIYRRHKGYIDKRKKEKEREECREQRLDWQ